MSVFTRFYSKKEMLFLSGTCSLFFSFGTQLWRSFLFLTTLNRFCHIFFFLELNWNGIFLFQFRFVRARTCKTVFAFFPVVSLPSGRYFTGSSNRFPSIFLPDEKDKNNAKTRFD